MLMLICAMWLGMEANAQSNSSIVELNLSGSSNEMVRACKIEDQDYLMCYSEHSIRSDQRRFTLINVTTNAAHSFTFYTAAVGVIQNGVTGRTVSDLCVNEGYCYFCGTESYMTAGLPSSRGYVGRFSLSDVLAGSGSVEIVRVGNTIGINNLAVTGSSIVQIFATANVAVSPSFMTWDGDYNTSCLVEVDYEGAAAPYNRWSSCIVAPVDRDEVFSDIDIIDYGVGVVSKYRGNHQKFCVRNMKDGNGMMIDGDNWAHIQTANVFENTGDASTCRRESDKIFMGGGLDFFVAHSVDCNGIYGVAVYRMRLAGPADINAVSTQYWSRSGYESLMDLGTESLMESDFLTRAGSTCYVHNTDNGFALNTQYCNTSAYTLNSISTSVSGSYYAVGHDANGRFVYCKQRKQSVDSSTRSCLVKSSTSVAFPTVPSKHSGEGLWIFQTTQNMTAFSIPFTSISISSSVTCNH